MQASDAINVPFSELAPLVLSSERWAVIFLSCYDDDDSQASPVRLRIGPQASECRLRECGVTGELVA